MSCKVFNLIAFTKLYLLSSIPAKDNFPCRSMDFTLAHVNPPFDLFMLIPSIVMKYCNSMSCCGLLHHVIYLPRLLLSAYIMFNYICRCPCCPLGNGWHPQTMHLKRITPPRKCNFVYDDQQCNRLTLITVDSELLWLVERITVTVKCTIPLNRDP